MAREPEPPDQAPEYWYVAMGRGHAIPQIVPTGSGTHHFFLSKLDALTWVGNQPKGVEAMRYLVLQLDSVIVQ